MFFFSTDEDLLEKLHMDSLLSCLTTLTGVLFEDNQQNYDFFESLT